MNKIAYELNASTIAMLEGIVIRGKAQLQELQAKQRTFEKDERMILKNAELDDINSVLNSVDMCCKWHWNFDKIKVYTGLSPHSDLSHNSSQRKTTLTWKGASVEVIRRLTARIIELEGET